MKAPTRILLVAMIWGTCGFMFHHNNYQGVISDTGFSKEIIRDFDEETISSRLDMVEGVINLEYTHDTKKLIKRYMLQGRHETKKLIEKSFYYFPLFDHYFDLHKVPKELKYITLLESSLRVRRTSVAGAKGLWQLMPATARWMGLKVNDISDQRTNPKASTEAAVRYLSSLYDQFGDWNLVLLAYNAGPGTVKSAIRRANSKKIEDLLPYLPKQTRKYIPFYTATVYALNYYNLYNIKPELEKPSMLVHTSLDRV